MSQQKEVKEVIQRSPRQADSASGLLASYLDYAELCCDPEEVFSYLESKRICVGTAMFWRERAQLFCRMGNFRQAIAVLEEQFNKGEAYFQVPKDAIKFKWGIEQALKEIQNQLEEVLVAKSSHKRTLEEFNALSNEEVSHSKKLGEVVVIVADSKKKDKKEKTRLYQLLETCEKEYKEDLETRKKAYEESRKGKPRCSLRNDMQRSAGPKLIQRTHSILHRPNFDLSSFQANQAVSCVSPKSGMKFERKETMDSIEILKHKKSLPTRPPLLQQNQKEPEEEDQSCESRMYRTTSFLDKKRVHFESSNAKMKSAVAPRMEKFRSLNLPRTEERKTITQDVEKEQIKKIASEDEKSQESAPKNP